VVRGKPCYVSPEQARGEAVDSRSDLFSLGTVIYESLTGARAFDASTAVATMDKILAGEFHPPSQLNPRLHPELDRILARALAPRLEDRYARAADLQVALTRVLREIAPDYTSEDLAEAMRALFPEVDAREGGDGSTGPVSLRERLVDRLSAAEVTVDTERMSTGELLNLNTVSIPVAGRPARPGSSASSKAGRSAPRRRVSALAVAGIGSVILAAALAAILGPGLLSSATDPGVSPAIDAGASAAAPATRPATAPATVPATAPASAPATRPKSTGRRPPPKRFGLVSFSASPWAIVFLDGHRIAHHTPIRDVRVSEGRHKVRFLNPELRREKTVWLTVKPGSKHTVSVDLEAEGRPADGRAP
jgi:serine/threonine-protein kinase